jgi:Phage integrase, N-terminal SAM-like domain
MARRSYGTGSLFTARGKWYGQWRIGGQQVKRKLGPWREPGSRRGLTRKQAEAELRRRIETTETPTPAQAPSVGEAGERLVRSLEAQGRKASTLAAYESTLRAHLVPHFGDRVLHRISTEDVEGFIAVC